MREAPINLSVRMDGLSIGHRCAFAVITVVPEAHELFKAAVGRPAAVVEDGYPWTVVELPAQGGGTHLVVEGQAPDRSNQPAQAFAARMLRVWRPRNLILADIGGGIVGGGEQARDGLALGDVVVATELHYPEYAKLVPAEPGGPHGTRNPRHIRTQPISYRLSTLARQLGEVVPGWSERITTPRPVADGAAARLLPGEIVVGEKLLTDPDAAEVAYIVHTFDKALGVDMESIGVAVAALSAADDDLPVRFLVLRGISDWIDASGNQETRDNWKPYAADAAVAAALGVIAATPATFTPTERAEMESASELRRRISNQYPVPDTTYPNVVSGPDGTLLRGDVLATAAQRHGVVLVGEGGVGKTALIVQATVAAAAPLDPFPVLVDLKTWKPAFAEGLSPNPSGADLRPSMDALLRASVQRIGIDLLDTIVVRRDVLVIVDGLNEVPYGEVGSRILTLLDEYMRAHPNARVLVTDRRVSDFYRERNWVTLRLERLATTDVAEIVDDRFEPGTFRGLAATTQSLLRVPYFLDRAMRAGQLAVASRAGAMESFLRDHGGLTDEQIDELASIAFGVYEQRHSRTFPAAVVEDGLAAELVGRLRDAGVLTSAGGNELRFDHQLEHDYLAGRHLAGDIGRWTAEVFDAVTFEASSFDVLGLALERIEGQDRDGFVRQVYDWNWRGAISAVADVEQEGEAACSAELRMALLAVTAEKRFDPVSGTRERTNRQLGRFGDAYAQALVAAPSLDALTEVVAGLPACEVPWFERWRTVFCRMPPTPLTADEVLWLAEADSVIGWTAANTVRRFPFDADRAQQLRELYRAQPEPSQVARATRWRVVHALGAWPEAASAALLLDAVDHDEHDWVKYGAVRSLMEMAARTSDAALRATILDGLRARIGHIPREPLSQLAWAARYAGADAGFAAAVRPLLHAALDAQGTETDRERWQVRIQRFEDYWSLQAA